MKLNGKEATEAGGEGGAVEVLQPNGNGKGWQALPQAESTVEREPPHCGLGSWQPPWLRSFETTHAFMVVFLVGWVLQGVFHTYFVSVITTIEKLFRIKSKTTGLLVAATEVGQISTALLLTYYAGRGHRPRWIAFGMIVFSAGALACAMPHFIFGGRLLETRSVMQGATGNLSAPLPPGVCGAPGSAAPGCLAHVMDEQVAHSQMTAVVLPIFFAGLFAVGLGQTAICTLGIPYIDDNVASRESPLYIAITIGVRIVGPAGGFILGSFCTRVYADLTAPPGLTPSDPRWVGAWWLGLVLVAGSLSLMSLAMFCFPPQLPGSKAFIKEPPLKKQEAPQKPHLKDFPKALKRQLSNDILMLRTASSVLHLLPVAGLYTFLPKYLESQFRLASHDANLISGIGGILVMGIGILLSGAVILKFVPTARFVAGWIALTALAYSLGMLILIFVGCPMDDLVGVNGQTLSQSTSVIDFKINNTTPFYTKPVCESSCHCDKDKFNVICGQDGKTYFSACHAGCHNVSFNNGKMEYFNCECIESRNQSTHNLWKAPNGDYTNETSTFGVATGGYCTGNCTNFVLFICIFSFIMFTHATGEVGSILLIMRCTDPKDKALAMGIIQFAIGLFGNVPCPIIFGVVVDSACLLWDSVCQTKGACFLYDTDVFRHFFLGTTGGIMGLAFLVDCVVWYKAKRIDINPEADISDVISTKSVECISKPLPQDSSTTPLTAPTDDTTV